MFVPDFVAMNLIVVDSNVTNVNHMGVEVRGSPKYDSSSGSHEYLYKDLWQSM